MGLHPISYHFGYYGDFLVVLESIIVFLSLEFGFIFLRRFILREKDKRNYMILAWGLLFVCFAFTMLTFIITDFFIFDSLLRSQVINIGYISIMLGVLFFSINAEREIKSTKYIFTILLSAVFVILIAAIIFNFADTAYISNPAIIPVFIILLIYVNKFTKSIKEKWKLNVYGFLIGMASLIIGFAGTSDFILEISVSLNLSLGLRLLGDILMISGTSSVCYFFIGIPSLKEFEWMEKIKNSHLFIMHQSGVCVYNHSFKERKETGLDSGDESSQIIAGGLTGITQLLSTMINSKEKLEVIDHGTRKMLFEYGEHIISVLIIDEKLEIIQSKLKNLTSEIEDLFSEALMNWTGEVKQFAILDNIVPSIFKV